MDEILNDERYKNIPCGGALEEIEKLKHMLLLSEEEYAIKRNNDKEIKKHQREIHKLIKRKKFKMKQFDYFHDEQLTNTETDVLELLKGGYNYRECAEILKCSETTIKTHVNNIFSKTHVHSLQELLVKEFNRGKRMLELNTPEKVLQMDENAALEMNKQKLKNAMNLFKKRW